MLTDDFHAPDLKTQLEAARATYADSHTRALDAVDMFNFMAGNPEKLKGEFPDRQELIAAVTMVVWDAAYWGAECAAAEARLASLTKPLLACVPPELRP